MSEFTATFPAAPEGEEPSGRPTREQAEEAVRTLIRWAGDDPSREGLADTPARVARAYEDWFSGYRQDPATFLGRTFSEIAKYDEMVILKDIPFSSHCEHHMAPITGRVHVGYLPRKRVVGISKLARLVQAFARRLQIQERLTAEIADALQRELQPLGVAVMVEATHACMTTRGVNAREAVMTTSRMLGIFRDNAKTRGEFLAAIGK